MVSFMFMISDCVFISDGVFHVYDKWWCVSMFMVSDGEFHVYDKWWYVSFFVVNSNVSNSRPRSCHPPWVSIQCFLHPLRVCTLRPRTLGAQWPQLTRQLRQLRRDLELGRSYSMSFVATVCLLLLQFVFCHFGFFFWGGGRFCIYNFFCIFCDL